MELDKSIIPMDLLMPDKAELAAIMQNELSTDFEEVTVEWVQKCPNLTRKPFYLTSPGLCGDTAILDIGGISNLFPFPKRSKIFHFKKLLEELNRIQNRNFIVGGGLCTHYNKYLAELIMDASFLPANEGIEKIYNRSHYAFQKIKEEKLQKKVGLQSLIATDDPSCIMYGNFFVSEGQRREVLKVHAKNRTGREFVDALQHAISRYPHKTYSQLIGFGGMFTVKNGIAVHHVIQNDWLEQGVKNKKDMHKCIRYNKVNATSATVMAFATFISADRYYNNTGLKGIHKLDAFQEIFLTRSRAYGRSSIGGGQYLKTILQNDTKITEYLGYFSLATKLYRIDPVPMFYEMPDLSYLSNY